MTDAGWVPGDPVYPYPDPEEILTTCHVCTTTWNAEVSSCPNGCVWEGDNENE